jgi:hypothetical protein
MNYAEPKNLIGNIDPKALILQDIHFNNRKLELTEAAYHKATLNNDYESLHWANDDRILRWGIGQGLKTALRYLLAQEAEASGRKVSATMVEFDGVIEELVDGKG